jgi:hypothetical protein
MPLYVFGIYAPFLLKACYCRMQTNVALRRYEFRFSVMMITGEFLEFGTDGVSH